MPTFIFVTKPQQHFIFAEAVPTFIFVMKPQQHSTLALEVAPSFTLKPWSNINTSFASKQPRQHFIRRSREATSTLYFRRNCANVYLYHKAIFRGNIAQTLKAYSTVARHQDFRDANKMLKMQGVPIKTLKMQGLLIKILKMPMKP